MSNPERMGLRNDQLLRPIPAVVAGVAASLFLLIIVEAPIIRLLVLAIMLALLVTLRIPALKRVLLAAAILEIPIQVDIYLNHDEVIAEANTLSGFNLSFTTVVLVTLYALWVAELAGGFTRLSPPALKAAVPSFAYVTLVVLSLAAAGDTLLALYEIVLLIQVLMLFVYILHHVRSRHDLQFVVVVLVAGLLVQSVIALGLWVYGEDVVVGMVKADIDDGRVNGTFGSPNVLGSYLTLLLPVALSLMFSPARPLFRRLGGVAFGLGSLALVVSFSRGAWVGYVVSVAFVVFVAWRRRWLVGPMPAAIGLVALLLVAVFQNEILLRLSQYNNQAAQSRLPLMDLAYSMIRDRPLQGVGANNFAASLDAYVTVEYSRAWISTVHNKYLLVWAETGVLALLAFLWVLVAATVTGWRQSTGGDRLVASLGLGLAAGLIGNMIHMTVELFHGRPQLQLLWLVVGLILALPRIGRSEPAPADRLTRVAL